MIPHAPFDDAVLFDTLYPVERSSIPFRSFMFAVLPEIGVVPDPGTLDEINIPSPLVPVFLLVMLLVTPASEMDGGNVDTELPCVT